MLSLRSEVGGGAIRFWVELESTSSDQGHGPRLVVAAVGLQRLEQELDRLQHELEEIRRAAQLKAAHVLFERYIQLP